MRLDFLVEREEIIDICLRERHATVFNMLGARPTSLIERHPITHDWRAPGAHLALKHERPRRLGA